MTTVTTNPTPFRVQIYAEISYVSTPDNSIDAVMLGAKTFVGRPGKATQRDVRIFVPKKLDTEAFRSAVAIGTKVLVLASGVSVETERTKRGTFARFAVNNPTSLFVMPAEAGVAKNLIPDSGQAKLDVQYNPNKLKIGEFLASQPLGIEVAAHGRMGVEIISFLRDEKEETFERKTLEVAGKSYDLTVWAKEGQELPYGQTISVNGRLEADARNVTIVARSWSA